MNDFRIPRLHEKPSDIAFHCRFPIDFTHFSDIRGVFLVRIEQSVCIFTNSNVLLSYRNIIEKVQLSTRYLNNERVSSAVVKRDEGEQIWIFAFISQRYWFDTDLKNETHT